MKIPPSFSRVVIKNVTPEIACGKYPIKRIPGEPIKVEADIFSDSHDVVRASLIYKKINGRKWKAVPMNFLINDHWEVTFSLDKEGEYIYTINAWIDHFAGWCNDIKKKFEAGQEISVDLRIGASLIEKAIQKNTNGDIKKKLESWVKALMEPKDIATAVSLALSEEVGEAMNQYGEQAAPKIYEKNLKVSVERKRALFSAWYEFFPRSTALKANKHGTFKESEKVLPRIAEMGFDVVYLPPIHPIGKSFRKGKNNNVISNEWEPGSPWAIGNEQGGHKSINPELGDLKDFKSFVKKANKLGIEVALDYAIQCSPDHPYVKEHPKWFKWRPDGTVQYAENPPKKYQDVLPVNFENDDWKNLWTELKSILEYWIEQGVTIFRVDNPHTKPFEFWEWLLPEINKKYPGVIFLAEAFTRPRRMEQLAQLGFQQSYTYFTWRNSKYDFQQYLYELTQTPMREYFRPNFWPNTPDILHEQFHGGGDAIFIIRHVLAATLSSNYGIYGPVYEFGIHEPLVRGKEEYLDSEKYEIKLWDWEMKTRIRDIITDVNKIRNENPALQTTFNIQFCDINNDQLMAYLKKDATGENLLLIIVCLNPDFTQSGLVKVPLYDLGQHTDSSFNVTDLLTGARYNWHGEWNYVELHPKVLPAHIFKVEFPY